MNSARQFRVKKLARNDIEGVLRIAEECSLAVWKREDYQQEVERGNSFLAGVRIDDNLVGFIAVRIYLSETNNNSDYSEADILNIGVLESFRGKGIGSLLLDEFLDKAQKLKIRNVWLEVRKSNLEARSFYRRKRFVEIYERRNFYAQPTDDAVVMKFEVAKN